MKDWMRIIQTMVYTNLRELALSEENPMFQKLYLDCMRELRLKINWTGRP